MSEQNSTQTRVDQGLLLLRLGGGAFMAFSHGLPKLLAFSEKAAHFADPLHIGPVASFGLATGAEFVGALLVLVGFFTRPAAAAVLFTMLVAGLVQHAGDPWNKKELALLFALVFGTLLTTGPGALSVDAWLKRRRDRLKERPESATREVASQSVV
ncbi:MAG: DoxX family protein [Myxococcales bacterium]